MYVNLADYIRDLESKGLTVLASKVKKVSERYPKTIRAYKDHFGVVRLCSSEVNIFTTHTDFYHSKGSRDGSLEVMPFIEDNGEHIYADPPVYTIGYVNPYGFGDVQLPDWEEKLKEDNIPREIIKKVRMYFLGHAPANYKDIP